MEVVDMDMQLHVGQGAVRGPLTIFPVWTGGRTVPVDYLVGAQAPVDVEERAGSPAVDQLIVTNRAALPVLLPAGELVEGGMQHRAVRTTVLLAPARPTFVEVVCVEAGRWHGGTRHVRRARRVPGGVRARLARPHAQQEVWDQVRRYDAVAGPSATESLPERLDRTAAAVRDMASGLVPLAGQRGLLVGIAGRPAWLEVFDTGDTLHTQWAGLLEAAAFDALGRPPVRTPAASARSFAERVEKTALAADGPAGLGRRLAGGRRTRVDAVRFNHRFVHVTAIDTFALQEA